MSLNTQENNTEYHRECIDVSTIFSTNNSCIAACIISNRSICVAEACWSPNGSSIVGSDPMMPLIGDLRYYRRTRCNRMRRAHVYHAMERKLPHYDDTKIILFSAHRSRPLGASADLSLVPEHPMRRADREYRT